MLGYGLRTAEKIPPIWIIQGTEDRIVSLTICCEENRHTEMLTLAL